MSSNSLLDFSPHFRSNQLMLPRLPRAIATSSSHRAVASHLGASGVVSRFHAVVAKGDYARGKPHPDPYLKAAERLGIEPKELAYDAAVMTASA